MSIEWVELSKQKRKALHIILTESNKTFGEVAKQIGITKCSMHNKLENFSRFKKPEYQKLLEVLGIKEEELEKSANSFIVKLVLEKEKK